MTRMQHSRALLHNKQYQLLGVHTVALTVSKNHTGRRLKEYCAVRAEGERLGISRVL